MTFDQLLTATAPDSSGDHTLKSSDFPAGVGVARLLETYFVDGQVTLSGVEQTSDAEEQTVLLEGTLGSGFLGLPDLGGKVISFKGSFFFSIGIPEVSIVLSFADDWSLVEVLTSNSAYASIEAALNIDIAKKLEFPVVNLELSSGNLSVAINISPNQALGLSELAEYVQGADVVSQFPTDGFPSFTQNLTFVSFGIGARIEPMTLAYLTAEVALNNQNASWAPFEDLVEFRELRAAFLLMNPLGSPTASVHVEASALIAGKEIVAAIDLPSMAFQCMLGQDETIELKELLALMGVAELPMPNVVCDELEVLGDPESSTFELYVGFSTDIKLELPVGTLTIEQLQGHFTLITAPERETGAEMSGRIGIGSTIFEVSAASYPGESGWIFAGGLSEGSVIDFGELIKDLDTAFDGMSERPEVLEDSLKITNLQLSIHSQTRDFHFICEAQFPLDGKTAHLLLSIDIINTTDALRKTFSGVLTLGTRSLSVIFDQDTNITSLIAAFENEEGEDINLVDDVIGLVTDPAALALPDDDFNLLTFQLYLLEFSYLKEDSAVTYGFKGDLGWSPQLGLNSDASEGFDIRAYVDLKKVKEGPNQVYGIICGKIENTIEGLDFLKLQACYEIYKDGGDALKLLLQVGPLPLQATYTKTDTTTTLTFGVRTANDLLEGIDQGINEEPSLTLGEIATFFVSLVDPSVIEYEFEPPWDGLANIDLIDFLEMFELKLEIIKETGKKNVTKFTIDFDLSELLPGFMSSFVRIDKFSLTYAGSPEATGTEKKKSVTFNIEGEFLGQAVDDLSWDPVDGKAPEVPGQGISVFDLRYLGMGQRVAITQASNVASIGEVMDLLRGVIDEGQAKLIADRSLTQQNPLSTFGDGGAISFSPESEWLIGLDVSLLKVLNLTVIFNDPVIYGLRIELDGEMAKNFAGLKFEILYQKITDDIGKYHVDLTLPDFVRHFTVGAVSVTLPIIVIDIFTNGDFKLDFGFPWNFNYSRSFAIEVFPFTGAGGFYFNKLSAATATSTPAVVDGNDGGGAVGVFTPVYEFGLGLKIGLGKTFNSGPLKAEISITVQGIIEGVISWYNPRYLPPGTEEQKELYYAIRGGVAIVGRLYGEVDFKVISVSIEVVAKATVQFMVESYKDILIHLSAEVSVKAKAKVLFVKVTFKFSMTVEQKFTIDGPQHGQTAPWLDKDSATPSEAVFAARAMAMRSRSIFAWNWATNPQVVASRDIDGEAEGTDTQDTGKVQLDIFFQPAYTWVNDTASATSGTVKGEALLFIENATEADRDDFATLAKALFQWTCEAGGFAEELSLNDANQLYTEFVEQPEAQFTFEELSDFLFTHFDFRFQAMDGAGEVEGAVMEGTIFPMFPQLSLYLGEVPAADDDSKAPIRFDEVDYVLSPEQLDKLKEYFAKLKVQFAPNTTNKDDTSDSGEMMLASQDSDASSEAVTITSFIFTDYFKIIIRAALQAAIDELEAKFLAAKADKIQADKEAGPDEEVDSMEVFEATERAEPYSISTDLLPEIDFESIANMASRFLMHGICLPPISVDDQPALAKQPLYQATAQQFDFSDAKVGKKFIFTLLDEHNQSAFKFGAGTSTDRSFTYELDEYDVDATQIRFPLANTIHILEGLATTDIPFSAPSPAWIDFYGDEDSQINFALRKATAWGDTQTVIDFPKSLTAYLQRNAVNPAFVFNKAPISDDQPRIDDFTTVTGFKLATRIDIDIKQILNSDGTGFLPDIYLLLGANEREKDLLEAILDESASPNNISLAYIAESEDKGTYLSPFGVADKANVVIVKTNLSTGNRAAATDFSTAMDETNEFLCFIWEGSTVGTGGYYIKIPHGNSDIDEQIFRKESVGQITLIIEFDVAFATGTNTFVPADYHTAAILTDTINLEEQLLLAQSTETVPVLRIPAGHVGFEVLRDEATDVYTDFTLSAAVTPKASPDDDADDMTEVPAGTVDAINLSGDYLCIADRDNGAVLGWIKLDADTIGSLDLARNELDEIYQLLGYSITDHPLTDKSDIDGLPVGPTGEGEWLYERIIPTFSALAADVNDLPPADRNPYLGIKDQAIIKMNCWWQDLYGNKLSNASFQGTKDLHLGYTDPLIGINQWPSVLERYQITAVSDSVAKLKVELAFNPNNYLWTLGADATTEEVDRAMRAREKAVNAALAKYEQIYFQFKEEDVALTIKTTLFEAVPSSGFEISEDTNSAKKDEILTFISTVYKFLKSAQLLVERESTSDPIIEVRPLVIEVDLALHDADDKLKYQGEFIYSLKVFAETTRSESLAHPTLKDTDGKLLSDYESVIKSIDYFTPKQSDLQTADHVTSTTDQSLQQLVASTNGAVEITADLLRSNLFTPGLLATGADAVQLIPAEITPDFASMKLSSANWEMLQEVEPQVTISTEVDTLDQLRQAFEDELNEARQAAIDSAQETLRESLESARAVYEADLDELGNQEAAEIAALGEDATDSDRQEIEDRYKVLANERETAFNLEEKQIESNHTKELQQLQASIVFTIEDLAAVIADVTEIFSDAQDWKLPEVSPLRQFAKDFEAALPGLYLAISEDRSKKNQAPDETRPLYIVQLGAQGVTYDIQEQVPAFYAIPPMANTLLSGNVMVDTYGTDTSEVKRFDGVDLNELVRDFLVAVEDFLEPDSLINAHQLASADTLAVIGNKSSLADSISDLVEPVLDGVDKTSPRVNEAKSSIRQQMLINLIEGYDVETIVQFEVTVTVGGQLTNASELSGDYQPRIVGKAKVVRVLQGEDPNNLVEIDPREVDFSLSLGKIPLQQVTGTSYFTYLFDTKTPEKYANLYLELEFHSVGIEYKIEDITGVSGGYQASDWLSLIRPEQLTQSMGQSAVPIPLRDFPMPPSLIFQRAEPDPTSREELADVRQWKYTIMFEHLDVAQDKVDCLTKLNEGLVVATDGDEAEDDGSVEVQDTTEARDTLFESLVNFSQVYPALKTDLSKFRLDDVLTNTENSGPALGALTVFSGLVAEVASCWDGYIIPSFTIAEEDDSGQLHYEISEEPLGDLKQGFVKSIKTIAGFNGLDAPEPMLEMPGYKEFIPTSFDSTTQVKTFTYEEDPEDQSFFGDSDIPDRKFMIENLDVIPHQNAWASVWLSRNEGLLKNADGTDVPTNPKFVFRTPTVRFNNMVTPVIINDEPWNIGTIGSIDGEGVSRSLQGHLEKMFETLFPDADGENPYEVQLSCRYAFALGTGLGLNDDLKPSLPILLSLRLSSSQLSADDEYPAELAGVIEQWLACNRPSEDEASLIFSVSMFSKLDEDSNTSLPMLRIEHLELFLTDIDLVIADLVCEKEEPG